MPGCRPSAPAGTGRSYSHVMRIMSKLTRATRNFHRLRSDLSRRGCDLAIPFAIFQYVTNHHLLIMRDRGHRRLNIIDNWIISLFHSECHLYSIVIPHVSCTVLFSRNDTSPCFLAHLAMRDKYREFPGGTNRMKILYIFESRRDRGHLS